MNNHICGSLRPFFPAIRGSFALHRVLLSVLTVCFFSLYVAAQSPLPVLPPMDSLNEMQVADFSQKFQTAAQAQRTLADLQLHNAQALRTTEETTLATLKADTLTPKDQIAIHEKNVKTAKTAEKVALKNFKQAEKNVAFVESIPALDSLTRRKSLPKALRQLHDLQTLLYPPPPPVVETPSAVIPAPADTLKTEAKVAEVLVKKKPEVPLKKYKTYDASADVMLHPPSPPCALAMDRRDEFSGETQRETARAELFRYTNPVLKSYLQGKVAILCEAALSSIGPNTTLLLTFTIRDPNVRKAFGSLPKNSIATLQMLDGSTFTINNKQLSEALPDDSGQVFTFHGQYPLDKTVLKKLHTTGLDKVRIAWATGYEDYEVHNVDLLLQQAQCLEK